MSSRKRRRTQEASHRESEDTFPVGYTIDFSTSLPNPHGSDDAPRGGGTSQVLPVAQLPGDHVVGVDGPTSAEEYLWAVRQQADNLPSIARASKPTYNPYPSPGEDDVPENADQNTVVEDLGRLSEEWRKDFIEKFLNLRKTLLDAPPPSLPMPPQFYPIPIAKDESAWKSYIFGRKRKDKEPAEKNGGDIVKSTGADSTSLVEDDGRKEDSVPDVKGKGKALTELEGDDMDVDEREMEEGSEAVYQPKDPTPTLLSQIDQPTTVCVISYFNTWITERLEAHIDKTSSFPSTRLLPPALRNRKSKTKAAPKPPPMSTLSPSPSTLPASFAASSPEFASSTVLVTKQSDRATSILTPHILSWLLSLLASRSLTTLLTSDDIAILRDLCRLLKRILGVARREGERAQTERAGIAEGDGENETIRAKCWMVIAAVVAVWGQSDLWEV